MGSTKGRYQEVKDVNKAYYLKNKNTIAASRYAWHKARYARIIQAYGGACACGSTDVRLEKLPTLSPEAQHLKGGVLHKWVVDQGFPEGFRLRCPTCIKAQKTPASLKCRRWRSTRTTEQVAQAKQANLRACAVYRKNHPDRRLEIKRNRRAAKLSTGTITTAQWEQVKEAAGHRCVACHKALKLSMDHIIPLVKGGPHTIENIQPLCHSCNSRKNVKTHDYRTPEMKQALGIVENFEEGGADLNHVFIHGDRKGFYVSPPVPPKPPTPPVPWPQGLLDTPLGPSTPGPFPPQSE